MLGVQRGDQREFALAGEPMQGLAQGTGVRRDPFDAQSRIRPTLPLRPIRS